MYAKCIKRVLDFFLSLCALIVLSPLLLILTGVGAVAMGGNPFFTQSRPGKDEKIFKLIKFRTMNNKKDKDGKLLPDEQRLTGYGKWLRSTSLDELPELFNILVGNMSFVGPRPLLISYLPWYTDKEKHRHDVRPGLTGLAQVNGRNYVEWDKRLLFDQEYVKSLSFKTDLKVIFETVKIVLKHSDVAENTAQSEGNLAEIRKTRRELENEHTDTECRNEK